MRYAAFLGGSDHIYLNQNEMYEKNTSQAIICDKIERFLWIQAHFQAVNLKNSRL